MFYRVSLEQRKILLALLAVYSIWGSTYLAVRVALGALPPFVLGGVRFTLAGLALLAWSSWRGAPRPTWRQVGEAAVGSFLMLVVGHGAALYASQAVPSGVVALLGASLPLWMTLLAAARRGGERPGWTGLAGLAVASVGMALLIHQPEEAPGAIPTFEAGLVLLGTLGWALGSIHAQRSQAVGGDPTQRTGLQMALAGLVFSALAVGRGEVGAVVWGEVGWEVVGAVVFLTVFGSLVAFSAYVWLASRVSASVLATHAYVNPLVALGLGVALGGEVLTWRTVLASALVLAAVVLLTLPPSVVRRLVRAR